MAKIVNKEEKRKQIALACKDLFLEKGLNVSVSELAKVANIGKGTIYQYFTNKEDIIFEIVNILLITHNEKKLKEINSVNNTKDKIKMFFKFYYDEEEIELRRLYKKFISISLTNSSKEMIEFNTKCENEYFEWFENILKEGIENNEIKKEALNLSRGLFAMGLGCFIVSEVTHSIDNLEQELNSTIDYIWDLIKK